MTNTVRFSSTDAPTTLTIPAGETALVVEDGFTALPGQRATHIHIQEGSHLVYSLNIAASTAATRELRFTTARGASVTLLGIVLHGGTGTLKLRLHEDHAEGESEGRMTIHGLLKDAAQLDVAGLISIRPGANQANAFFEGRALLLGEEARATIEPKLEIEARDVRASHAAAAGPIDPEQRFYLQSRGLKGADADALIIGGFVDALLFRVPDASIRQELTAAWHERIAA